MRAVAETRRYRVQTLEVRAQQSTGPGVLWKAMLLLGLVLLVSLSYVWLQSATETLNRDAQSLRRTIREKGREMENLQIENETYRSGRYIGMAVERFGLQLRPAAEGQVRRMSLSAPAVATGVHDHALIASN